MRVNQVVLVPGIPQTGSEGLVFGRYSEREAIHAYMDSVFEHLEEDRVLARIHSDLEPIQPNTLLIHCQIGWEKPNSKAKCNMATVDYVGQGSLALAALLCESLVDWGKSYVDFHHKTGNPKIANDPTPEGTIAVILKPFRINGPNVDLYMNSLDQLGRTIAYAIYEFMVSRNEIPEVARV